MSKASTLGLTGVLAALAAGAGSMAWTGHAIEKQLTTDTRASFAKFAPLVTITELKYEKSLASATRTLSFQVGCGGDHPLKLVWRDHIKHGPLPGFSGFGAATVDSELVLSDKDMQQLRAQLGLTGSPLTVKSRVSFGGEVVSDYTVPAMASKGPQGGEVKWQGMTMHTVQNGDAINYEMHMPGFEISAPGGTATWRMGVLKTRGTADHSKYWWAAIGTDESDMAWMDFSGHQGMQSFDVIMRNVHTRSSTSLDGDLINSSSKMTGTLEVGKARFEPASMSASVSRLHAPTIEKFIKTLSDSKSLSSLCANASKRAQAPGMNSEFANTFLKAAQDVLPNLVQYNPEYRIDSMKGTYLGKEGALSYSIGTHGMTATELRQAASNPAGLLKHVVASGNIRMPIPWLRALLAAQSGGEAAPNDEVLAARIESAAQQGMLVREGDILVTKASIKEGVAQVNGKAMPLPGMVPAANGGIGLAK